MTRSFRLLFVLSVFAGLAWLSSGLVGQNRTGATPSLAAGDWPHYTADMRGSEVLAARPDQRRQLQQARSRVALQDRHLGPRPEYKLEGTPLAINGVLYTTGGTRRSVVALDGKTGELIWAHSLREGKRAGVSPRQLSGRGRLVLDRRPRRRPHPLRHDRLSPGRAQREERRADRARSARTASST